jgi:hypothetical protein
VASIKIAGHRYTTVNTAETAYGAETFEVKDHKESTRETVIALFEIADAEPFKKSTRSPNEVQPRTLTVEYYSLNGSPWSEGRSAFVTANNIKKDGSLGATIEVNRYDFPKSLTELFREGSYSVIPGGPAFEWINSEYPR